MRVAGRGAYVMSEVLTVKTPRGPLALSEEEETNTPWA